MNRIATSVMMVFLMVISLVNPVVLATEQPIDVFIDGMELTFSNPPRVINDRTFVPLRGIFEAMGATVIWNEANQSITVLRLDSVVKLTIGSSEAEVNKEQKQLDAAAVIFDGSTFVPLRFISESIGAEVEWNGTTQTVTITTDKAHWADPGDNLSLNLIFTGEWFNVETTERMSFDPEQFIEINSDWPDMSENFLYSYSAIDEDAINIIKIYQGSMMLKDHWLEFNPETRLLEEYLYDEVINVWGLTEEDIGEAVDKQYSYADHEHDLVLYYPAEFAQQAEERDGYLKVFPSQQDNNLLQYWIVPNTSGETVDDIVVNTSAEEIYTFDNIVVGWTNDLNWTVGADQISAEEIPTAFYWLIEPDWLFCVAISCETAEQATDWCARIMVEDVVKIEKQSSALLEQEGVQTEADISDDEVQSLLDEDDTTTMSENPSEFSYVDEEYSLILFYPSVFASEPEDPDALIMKFPSQKDNALLQYWVISNTYEETLDSFVENTPAEEIEAYNNVAIGWKNDLNQETGEVSPTAYFWVVEQDWIACVAISCDTEEQAVEWCRMMIEDNAIIIDSY